MAIEALIVVAATMGFALMAARLAQTPVTAPMFFLALGYLFSGLDTIPTATAEEALHLVAEIALIVLLFLDAAQIDLWRLRKDHGWPVRMLTVGLPLTIILGTIAALPFLGDWPFFAVVLIAAILAPTDAALGQAVILNPLVPERIRRALTVESGLNDGLALPLILLFASITADAAGAGERSWLLFGAMQLIIGPAVGATMGWIGGKMLLAASDRGYTSPPFEGIGALGLAAASYLAADIAGGNGFISAFTAGLLFGNTVKGRCKFVYEFTESEGQLLAWAAFFLLGLALVPDAVANLSWPVFAVICGSLFLVRPLAIYVSLFGTGLSPTSKLFFGWFGPRGLATALFALLVFKDIGDGLGEQVLNLAINAVWISTLLHGLSAAPAARWYARKIQDRAPCPELEPLEPPAEPSSHPAGR